MQSTSTFPGQQEDSAAVVAVSPSKTPPATPLTPLQLRQWQRTAQRSVRLAVTAFKAGRTRVQEATDLGTAAATSLTNSLLTLQYLPAMQLPQSLKSVQGLHAAAASKLQRQQQQHLQALAQAVDQAAAAVTSMQAALVDVQAQLGSGQQQQQQQPHDGPSVNATSSPGISIGSSGGAASSAGPAAEVGAGVAVSTAAGCAGSKAPSGFMPTAPGHSTASMTTDIATGPATVQCSRMAIFHILTLPEAAALLQRVLHMHQQDVVLKQQVLDGFTAALPGQHDTSAAGNTRGRSSRQGAGGDATEDLRRQLTVLITCWMTKPHVDDDAAAQLLQVLADEMTGF